MKPPAARKTLVSLARTMLVALAGLLAVPADAHEVRPAYLEIRALGGGRFGVLWKVPARGEMRLSLAVRMPDGCTAGGNPSRTEVAGAVTERWVAECGADLAGQSIAIEGLEATLTDALVRVERADGSTQVTRLTPAAPAFVVDAAPRPLGVAATYVWLGIEHIWLGVDHLLFLLCLLVLVPERRRLVGTITAFTVAHSLTLAASTLGLVQLSQAPVEAIIALSIVFVASEIVHEWDGRPGLTRRWPWVVAFCFGLLHGFGFAGALREVGLPESAIPLALLCFNLGVEIGQLAFVLAALPLLAAARRRGGALPAFAQRAPVYGIGSLAAFWTLERVASFWR